MLFLKMALVSIAALGLDIALLIFTLYALDGNLDKLFFACCRGLLRPVHAVSQWLNHHRPHNVRLSRLFFAAILMVAGSSMAHNAYEQSLIHPFIWDAIAYLLHGFGAAPIINLFLE